MGLSNGCPPLPQEAPSNSRDRPTGPLTFQWASLPSSPPGKKQLVLEFLNVSELRETGPKTTEYHNYFPIKLFKSMSFIPSDIKHLLSNKCKAPGAHEKMKTEISMTIQVPAVRLMAYTLESHSHRAIQ